MGWICLALCSADDYVLPEVDERDGGLDCEAQKFYKSYRTRRNLADYTVVLEKLWWKALDFAALGRALFPSLTISR
ncbi:unnamed protein product [Linum trigynum]|uniref:Uncharacterized protein n=1 Tax=Linum trigynum TaxID=586398 RepID=A0AAV2EBF0_9ROSI